jgi:hypothetical protein
LIKDNHLAWGIFNQATEDVLPRGEGILFPHPNPLPEGEGTSYCPHPSPLPRGEGMLAPGEAVRRARDFLLRHAAGGAGEMTIEIEVDTLEQLADVLPAGPDIVLLDNMTPEQLRRAVILRNRVNPGVELEASGGVDLASVRAVAETGVERISVGALTHSAPASDFGLDDF